MDPQSPRRRMGLPAAIVLLAAAAGFAAWILYGPNHFSRGEDATFTVSRGEPFASVVDTLEARGILRSRIMFMITVRLFGGAERVQVGKYSVQSGISNAELFLMLRSGKGNLLIQVTVPEGSRIRSQARLFARTLGIDSAKYASLAFDAGFASSLGVNQPSLEGYLLPDTYGFFWEQEEREILRRQVEHLQRLFNDTLRARAAEFGWDMHKVLTFASIVEGEVVLNEERPIVAGVYHNRLRKRMKLEADPTIQYMIPDGPRRILYADLKADNPYNTYRFAGLPPGPVNNPGRASILASLYPFENDFIFFVANGRGGHWFSRTYADHLRYARMYKRHRANGGNRG